MPSMVQSEIKFVEYQGMRSRGEVAYAILSGGVCVFTYSRITWAIDSTITKATSTINAAEAIVAAICRQEGISRDDLYFYDLQTARGYDKPLGLFQYDRLKLDRVLRWQPEICPAEVIRLFAEFLGENPRQWRSLAQ